MGSDSSLMLPILRNLAIVFKIHDLSAFGFFVGIETVSVAYGMLLSQRRYTNDILRRVGMLECKPLVMPMPVLRPMVASTKPCFDPT